MKSEKYKKIRAQIDLASGSDENKIVKTITEETDGNVIGVLIPRSGAPRSEFAKTFRPLKEDICERNAQVKSLALPPVNLTPIPLRLIPEVT